MIVSALDGDGTFTAAQVSHKLKQQFACVPHQKKSWRQLAFERWRS